MPEIPETIGRYTVHGLLGRGAMGTVYLAEDPLLKRRLAIKVVRAVGDERDQALERFKREAEISARLNHPNVVTIYDVGEEPTLGPFLAMEYVEGSSLGKLIQEGNLEVETCLGILIQAMRALRAAHRHAIVHRDVKPDNILVSEDGRVKLMDFGIAKTMAPRATAQGEFLGSPAYSAPELLRGGEPTPNSDRYAFAVTAFELLTGDLPHPGANVAAVIAHVIHEPPLIPEGMSGPIAKVFRQALANDPDERFESTMDFLMALIDVYPLDAAAYGRVMELFRHDDHAGDIVPIRRNRSARTPIPTEAPAAPQPRATPARPLPVYSQTGAMKIELDPIALENPRNTPPPPSANTRPTSSSGIGIRPWVLVAWIVVLWIVGTIFWAVIAHMRS